MNLILKFRNLLDYPLRQFFRWRRAGLKFDNQSKQNIFSHLPSEQMNQTVEYERSYRERYHLGDLYNHSRVRNYCENLFYLEMMEKTLDALEIDLPDACLVADVGPSTWFYVHAQYNLLRWWRAPAGRTVALQGYEMDAYRVYRNFHSRADIALAHLRDLKEARYIPEKFTRQENTFDLVFMLFPFVFVKDHLEWGLPTSHFRPSDLLGR